MNTTLANNNNWFTQNAPTQTTVGGMATAPQRTPYVDPAGNMALGSMGGRGFLPGEMNPNGGTTASGWYNTGISGTGDSRSSSVPSGLLQPSGGAPSGGGGGDPLHDQFMSIMGNTPATVQNLLAKRQQLEQAGYQLIPNATLGPDGQPTNYDVRLPNGEVVDVIKSASTGGGGPWQWGMGQAQTAYGMQHGASSGPGGAGGGGYSPANSEGFKFRMQEGTKALENSAAARGTLLGGGQIKKVLGYAQGLASDEFNNDFNRLGTIANLGSGAANTASSMYGNIGNAQAGGTVGGANAWGNAISNIGNGIAGGLDAYRMTRPQPQQPR